MLGVAKTASADEIKKAYRAAAMKWHPDRWVDGTEAEKKTAEEKFKEASEAYSVLSDPDKKAKYDQFGFAGVDGQSGPDFSGGFGNLNDILNDLFGGGFSGFTGFGGFGGGQGRTQQQRVMKGRDIRTRIVLPLRRSPAERRKRSQSSATDLVLTAEDAEPRTLPMSRPARPATAQDRHSVWSTRCSEGR